MDLRLGERMRSAQHDSASSVLVWLWERSEDYSNADVQRETFLVAS